MSEYTKGPWVKDGIQLTGAGGKMVVISDGPSFGSASHFHDAEANSRLVIASPELLEALEELSGRFPDDMGDDGTGKAGFNHGMISAVSSARAAIAKAKGQ